MRHNKNFNHLGRKSAHRKSMLSNMASSLIENKRISTTLAKAKALRTYVEPIITKAKNDTTHSRRVVFSHLQNKGAVSELFRDVAVKIGERPGGYTRILRTGNRIGDNAEMCIIELVDYNETMLASQAEGEKPKRKRSRRGSGKKVQSPAAEVKQKDVKKIPSVKETKAAPAASEDNLAVEAKKDDTPVADVADNSAAQLENPEKEGDNQSEEKQD